MIWIWKGCLDSKKSTSSLLEQNHSKFHLYRIIIRNNLEKEHVFATHKFSSF
jgi:hypothetical protein